MKKIRLFVLLVFVAAFFTSCLTVEKKTYVFELDGKNSGTLTITWENIMSELDEGEDVSEEDFDELVNSYLNGDEIESQYPDATIVSKDLYVQNNKLYGKAVIKFDDLAEVKLYKYDKKGPYMLSMSSFSETYSYGNGTYGGDVMPVIFWDKKSKRLEFTTTVTEPNEDDNVSLAPSYNKWKR
jgi:hypothetical protein